MAAMLRSWRLFGVLVLATSMAIAIKLPATDLRSAEGTEIIVMRAVLCALPWLLVAFTASSLATLWPSRFTRWLLANRRYIGLAFAAGMGWHFALVGYFFVTFGNRLHPLDLAIDIVSLLVLAAMTLTSFPRFARRLSVAGWRRLHRTGIYVLWFAPAYFYFNDFLRDRDRFDAVATGVFLAAFALRVAARVRRSAPASQPA
jgi:DMSO/TMAO reductase YedYZ heme-binding membrane subunit